MTPDCVVATWQSQTMDLESLAPEAMTLPTISSCTEGGDSDNEGRKGCVKMSLINNKNNQKSQLWLC